MHMYTYMYVCMFVISIGLGSVLSFIHVDHCVLYGPMHYIIKERNAIWNDLIGLEPEAIDQSDSEKTFDWSRVTQRWMGSSLVL